MFSARAHVVLAFFTMTAIGIGIPSAGVGRDFFAYYTKVNHSRTDYMGKYTDIIVVIGEGRQLEFTRQTGFLPQWRTTRTVATVDDFFPGRGKDYGFEYNYVRLIKNTPEEIVVHWRYVPDVEVLAMANRQMDPLAIHGITGVVHELFTIHPDGTIEREIREAKGTRYREWVHPERANAANDQAVG